MINRYSISEIDQIWSEDNKLAAWWKVEQLVCVGWNQLGVIPDSDLKNLLSDQVVPNRERMLALEEITKHDVVAFTRMMSEQLGPEKKWVHLGLTSTDVVDSAQNYLIKQSNEVVWQSITELQSVLSTQAQKYKNLLIMGRSHGIYGEPTSLGLKFLLWFDEWNRHLERFCLARKHIEVVKISGSMGNHAHLELSIENLVAEQLGLGVDPISTQVTQRDRHTQLFSTFANMASTLEKMAIELRLFQRSEVNELAEGFAIGQKGSSSMPHKKNPISSENITGLARIVMSNINVALQNNALWHERDISHSSNERIILPDTYHLLVYITRRMTSVLKNLVVNEEVIAQHIRDNNNIFFSQVILTEILKTGSHSREEVYDFIQKATMECLATKLDFKEILIAQGITNYISQTAFEQLFNLKYFLRNVDGIYRRVLANA